MLGAAAVLERLGKDFHLGLIANQGAECRATLPRWDGSTGSRSSPSAKSRGFTSPIPTCSATRWDLRERPPRKRLMVGDRLDNDIAPAAALGMATAWVRWPRRAAKGWPTADDPEALDYLASLERASARADAFLPGAEPTMVIEGIAGLSVALTRWHRP